MSNKVPKKTVVIAKKTPNNSAKAVSTANAPVKSKVVYDINTIIADPFTYLKVASADDIGNLLTHLSDHYYNKTALVPDSVYDEIHDYMVDKYPTHPSLLQVGASINNNNDNGMDTSSDVDMDAILDKLQITGETFTNTKHRIKYKLPYWMGSMDKCKSGGSGVFNIQNFLNKYPSGPYVISDKEDGISALLCVRSDGNHQLFTRGDGVEGQDISCMIPYLKLPDLNAAFKKAKATVQANAQALYIRAELVMKQSIYLAKYADLSPNARNLVSGIFNAKTVKVDLVRDVDVLTYEIMEPNVPCMNPSSQFKMLENLGFTVAPHTVIQAPANDALLTSFLVKRKQETLYDIDGIIVADDHSYDRITSGNPKYATAFKIQGETKITEVDLIEWNVSKDGVMVPRIKLIPFHLSGTTITYTSGFNASYIVENKIGKGAKLEMIRSGEVIPYILRVVSPSTSGSADMPTVKYHWNSTKVDIIVDDMANNEELKIKRLVHFFSSLEVQNMAKATVVKFVDDGLDTVAAIIGADAQRLMAVPSIGNKMAEKLHNNIQTAVKNADLVAWMVASNAFGKGFGERKCKQIVAEIPDVIAYNGKTGELYPKVLAISGFAETTARAFVDHLGDFVTFMKTLPASISNNFLNVSKQPSTVTAATAMNPNVASNVSATATLPAPTPTNKRRFLNKNVVFTGIRNKEYEKIIEQEGGKNATTISKNTSMLVVVDDMFTSSKVDKANSLGIEVITIAAFAKRYNL